MKRICLAVCAVMLLLGVFSCKNDAEYDPYVKFIVNHLVENEKAGGSEATYRIVQHSYRVLKGHTLEGELARGIRKNLDLTGYAVIKYFSIPPKYALFTPDKDYVKPDAMPDESLMQSQITDLEHELFFEDTEVYAYYVKSAKTKLTFNIKCLDFDGVKYGDVPKVEEIRVEFEQGDELDLSLLEARVRDIAGVKKSMDGGKIRFADYSAHLYGIPEGASGDWYNADIASEPANLGEIVKGLNGDVASQDMCIGYEWKKPKYSILMKVQGLKFNESENRLNAFDAGSVRVDYDVLADDDCRKSLSEYIRSEFSENHEDFDIVLPNSLPITVNDVQYTKLVVGPDLVYAPKTTEHNKQYGNTDLPIADPIDGNHYYYTNGQPFSWQYVYDPAVDLSGRTDKIVKAVDNHNDINPSAFDVWTINSVIARDGIATEPHLFLIYQLGN